MNKEDIQARLLSRMGIAQLNPMQEGALSTAAANVVLLSPTGSGKTVAFAAMMLAGLQRPGVMQPQGVVIAPSRELVMQIGRVVRELAEGYKVVALYGGHSMADERNSLTPTPDIIVATPGRLLDHAVRRQLDLRPARVLVLDEYDKALELGFHDEMRRLVGMMPSRQRTILTSATRLEAMPDFMRLADVATLDYLRKVEAPRRRMQVVAVESPQRDKLATLTDLLRSLPNGRVIVFVNYRESADRLYGHLRGQGFPVGIYHGALEQGDREKAVDLLNNGTTPVLVSTDLGARGLDIEAVSGVVHYHMPLSEEMWTHRNGRTARVDASGTVYVLTSEADTIPDYIRFDRSYAPTGQSSDPIRATMATLYFNAGRKEKIARGDVAGFIIKQGGVEAQSVGRITLRDHSALAAVPADVAQVLLARLSTQKLKGKRVRISIMV